ncbi:MAG: ADP-forming succinate--CoA ligase subunit beta [Anaerolineales bacterium]
MKLHEYQSKQIFAKYHIPIPQGRIADNACDARQIAQELGGRVVIKAQVLAGGRGKAGGIRLARTPEEAEALTTHILGMEIKGLPVHKVLVDEAVNIAQEIYLAIISDREERAPLMMASSEGGVDIEEVAHISPEKISRVHINPLLGLRSFAVRDLAVGIDLPHQHWKSFIEIAQKLWQVYCETDASLVEINPLVITVDQRMLALDGKVVLDDNALFRHPDLSDLRDLDAESPAETEARKYGLSYIKMEGEIGCLVNGAGLAMATMDMIKLCGGRPANFLDVGGGASAERVAVALRLILSDPNVRVVLVNIFGGITRCDEVARGILQALSDSNIKPPMVVRLAGTNAKEGLKLLATAEVQVAETLVEAGRKAVTLASS